MCFHLFLFFPASQIFRYIFAFIVFCLFILVPILVLGGTPVEARYSLCMFE